MRQSFLIIGLIIFCIAACKRNSFPPPLLISERGYQPSISVDTAGVIRVAFGRGDSILFATSTDNGKSFSEEVLIDTLHGLHLGMSRGPQISSSANHTVIVAMNKPGDIYAYSLEHATNTRNKKIRVNDVPEIAKEGLSSIASDRSDNFYVTWLDLREDDQNKIYVSHSQQGGENWEKNVLVYRSPDSTVCECCRPSIAVSGHTVEIMFRNWLKGSRDMHVAISEDQAAHFSEPVKLGEGTWKLKGCPMDGGDIAIEANGETVTTWRREGEVYVSRLNQPEQKLGDGKQSDIAGNHNDFAVTWTNNGKVFIYSSAQPHPTIVGEGSYPAILPIKNSGYFLAWESKGKIVSLLVPATGLGD